MPHTVASGETDSALKHRPRRRLLARSAPARVAVMIAIAGAAIAAAAADSTVLVENWSNTEVGTRGVPAGWQKQSWGSPRYDFTVVSDGGARVLRLRSDDDSSTISKEVKIDVKEYPNLEWRWKVVTLPAAGDARRKETDDQAAQLYVTFPRFPTAVRSRIIGYIWDSKAPAGSIFPSQKVSTVRFVVVRSGTADLDRWISETRNVLEDYTRAYGEAPSESVGAISLTINSQNTHAHAESYFGDILFRKP